MLERQKGWANVFYVCRARRDEEQEKEQELVCMTWRDFVFREGILVKFFLLLNLLLLLAYALPHLAKELCHIL